MQPGWAENKQTVHQEKMGKKGKARVGTGGTQNTESELKRGQLQAPL